MELFLHFLLMEAFPVPNFTILSITIQMLQSCSGFSDTLYCLVKFGTEWT